MKILKRIELWILLALIGGAIAFVISTSGDDPEVDPDAREAPPTASQDSDTPFTVDASHLKRDYGNAVLEIHLTYHNNSDTAIELSSPTARLLSGSDPDAPRGAEEVSAFFLAFTPPPAIPPGETANAILKFWLEKPHLETALWLRILDDTLPIKTSAPLDLETIPNQETAVFTAPKWN
jgi:hypothetical protein